METFVTVKYVHVTKINSLYKDFPDTKADELIITHARPTICKVARS